jgi:hypothetical protein
MGVAVDESGEYPGLGKIDDGGSGGNGELRGGRDFGDAFALDDENHVVARAVAGGIEEVAGLNVDDGERSGSRSLGGDYASGKKGH